MVVNTSTCKLNYATGNNISESNIECILTNGNKLADLPSSATPFAVIKYGPTGSGKGSSLVQKEIEMLGVPLSDYAVFEIDSLVESVKNYRNKTLAIRNRRLKSKNQTYTNSNMFKNLTTAYFNTRKKLDSKLSDTIDTAIKSKKNFIFETTGTFFGGKNPIEWLIDRIKLLGENTYKIVLIYPLVTYTELAKRVKSRAEQQASRSQKPFYRAIDTDKLEPATLYAKQNLAHFILPQVYVKNIYKLVLLWNE
jgi:predicted ABC-type ATPase